MLVSKLKYSWFVSLIVCLSSDYDFICIYAAQDWTAILIRCCMNTLSETSSVKKLPDSTVVLA